jgi:hypothetical protein
MKTTTPKKTKHVRQWTNNEIVKFITADHDQIRLRIAEMETNVERWLKNNHEDVVAQIEVNRRKLISPESRIPKDINMLGQRIDAMQHEQAALAQEAKEVAPEPWTPKAGDKVKFKVPWEGSEEYGVGTIDGRDIVPNHVGVTWESGSKSGENVREIRPLTPAEIAKHLAEEEAKKPLPFGAHVDVIVDYKKKTYRIASEGPNCAGEYRLVPLGPPSGSGNIYMKRSDFTIIPEPK